MEDKDLPKNWKAQRDEEEALEQIDPLPEEDAIISKQQDDANQQQAEEEAKEPIKEDEIKADSVKNNNIIHTKLSGVSYNGSQGHISKLKNGEDLILIQEFENSFSTNAVAVRDSMYNLLGYIKEDKGLAHDINEGMGNNILYQAKVIEVTGGINGKNLGCNIVIYKLDLNRELLLLPSKIYSLQTKLATIKTKQDEYRNSLKNIYDTTFMDVSLEVEVVGEKTKSKFSNDIQRSTETNLRLSENQIYKTKKDDVDRISFEITMTQNELELQQNLFKSMRYIARMMSADTYADIQ